MNTKWDNEIRTLNWRLKGQDMQGITWRLSDNRGVSLG
jgi:hypothetical protein